VVAARPAVERRDPRPRRRATKNLLTNALLNQKGLISSSSPTEMLNSARAGQ
jgi:hypothetical protein